MFFALEGVFGNVLTLALSCLGFYFFGLIGLGYALVADNAICIIVYFMVNRRLYGYTFSLEAAKGIAYAVTATSLCFFFSMIANPVLAYSLMAAVFVLALVWGLANIRSKLKKSEESDESNVASE